jgi:hypothetical protein
LIARLFVAQRGQRVDADCAARGDGAPQSPAAPSTTATPAYVAGSDGETPTSPWLRPRVTRIASGSPAANPPSTCRMPCFTTSPKMSRRVPPMAMRIPISCVRRLTACATTA